MSNVSIISINLNNIAILNIEVTDYHFIINRISKREVVNLLQKAKKQKSGLLENIKDLLSNIKKI